MEVVTPAGYQSSTDIASSADPNNNTDNDDNGVTVVGNAIRSGIITLGPTANEPTGETPLAASGQGGPDDQGNMTVDFGFYQRSRSATPSGWTPTTTVCSTTASPYTAGPGDRSTLDQRRQRHRPPW